MFLNRPPQDKIQEYHTQLKLMGTLSKLFSESVKPYIHYRVAENIFCNIFGAENLARADGAFDAVYENIGIGIKTFILNGNSKIEKIAEFNSQMSLLRSLTGIELAKKLAFLRNERILIADRLYNVTERVYHIVGRDNGVIKIFEDSYDLIDLNAIEILADTTATLKFKDQLNEYTFNHSKSVLMKRFVVPTHCQKIDIEIIEDPIQWLLNARGNVDIAVVNAGIQQEMSTETIQTDLVPGEDYLILPLYSVSRKASGKHPIVPEKSQLNQWNAGGRTRNFGEVYISIPAEISDFVSTFLPARNVSFNLILPNGEILSAKRCQENGKALMTNPNNALSDWMLRDILNLEEGELLTYNKLEEIGYDCVKITKGSYLDFFIDFAPLNEYETFLERL